MKDLVTEMFGKEYEESINLETKTKGGRKFLTIWNTNTEATLKFFKYLLENRKLLIGSSFEYIPDEIVIKTVSYLEMTQEIQTAETEMIGLTLCR